MFGLSKEKSLMVAVMLSGTFLVVMNATMISPAFPAIMAEMGVDASTVQWMASGYALVEAVVIPLNAFFLGRLTTRRLFIGGMALFAVGALVAAVSASFPVLLAGRMMQAVGTGLCMPTVMTLIVLTFPRERRGSAMGVVGLIISFAPAIGPSLAGVLIDTVGWHMVFTLVTLLAVAIAIAAHVTLRNQEGFQPTDLDLPSIPLLLAGMLSLLYGLSSAASAQSKLVPVGLVALGIVLLALFARRQLSLERPLLRVQVLANRRYRTALLIMGTLMAALVGSEVVAPIFVQQVMGQSATASGLLLLPGAVLGAFSGLFAGRLFDRVGIRKPAVAGAIGLAIGAAGVFSFSPTMPIIELALVYTVIFLGIQFLSTPLNTWGLNALDQEEVPHANALSSTMTQVGLSVGSVLMGSLVSLGPAVAPAGALPLDVVFAGVHLAYAGMAALLFLAVIAILALVRTTRADREAQQAVGAAASQDAAQRGRSAALKVADLMNADPRTVSAEASVRDVIVALQEAQSVGIPLVDGEERPVGYVSDGDLLRYLARQNDRFTDGMSVLAIADSSDLSERLTSLLSLDAMKLASTGMLTVEASADAEEGFRRLAEHRVKKLVVVEGGRLVGTLSRRNVMGAMFSLEDRLTQVARAAE
ncbi:MDR family MFS transporter [Berryella wangjianweii]|nr:MDR family MFS transporter [Berryella wangjianweii]